MTVQPAKIDQLIEARVSPEQRQLLQRAADHQGRSLVDFVVSSAEQAALQVLASETAIRLAKAESVAFAEALLNPREPSPRLREAARRFLEFQPARDIVP